MVDGLGHSIRLYGAPHDLLRWPELQLTFMHCLLRPPVGLPTIGSCSGSFPLVINSLNAWSLGIPWRRRHAKLLVVRNKASMSELSNSALSRCPKVGLLLESPATRPSSLLSIHSLGRWQVSRAECPWAELPLVPNWWHRRCNFTIFARSISRSRVELVAALSIKFVALHEGLRLSQAQVEIRSRISDVIFVRTTVIRLILTARTLVRQTWARPYCGDLCLFDDPPWSSKRIPLSVRSSWLVL